MKFIVAEVMIELDEQDKPIYSVNYLGEHSGQGGSQFGFGGTSLVDLETNLKLLKKKLNQSEKEYVRLIKEKNEQNSKD